MQTKLPVHGFVLAGGHSTRMGEDKAMLRFRGRPMVELAVEKLRSFCGEVGIAGNRDDLSGYASVVHEARIGVGPAAGVEAGLITARLPWALFVPVDVPLVPVWVLREWAEAVVFGAESESVCASYLTVENQPQPAFCLLRKECHLRWSDSLGGGERRLLRLLEKMAGEGEERVLPVACEDFCGEAGEERSLAPLWFSNVNTPEELANAERVPEAVCADPQAKRAS